VMSLHAAAAAAAAAAEFIIISFHLISLLYFCISLLTVVLCHCSRYLIVISLTFRFITILLYFLC